MTSKAAELERPEPLKTVLVTQGVKTAHFVAQFLEARCHAANEA